MGDGRPQRIDEHVAELGWQFFCYLRLAAPEDYHIPLASSGKIDLALKDVVDLRTAPPELARRFHFYDRIGLRCGELPDMIATAQRAMIINSDFRDYHSFGISSLGARAFLEQTPHIQGLEALTAQVHAHLQAQP